MRKVINNKGALFQDAFEEYVILLITSQLSLQP